MAFNEIVEVSEEQRLLLTDAYYQSKDYHMYMEGVLFTKIVVEPRCEIILVFYRHDSLGDDALEYAIERAHSNYDVKKAYVIDTKRLITE